MTNDATDESVKSTRNSDSLLVPSGDSKMVRADSGGVLANLGEFGSLFSGVIYVPKWVGLFGFQAD